MISKKKFLFFSFLFFVVSHSWANENPLVKRTNHKTIWPLHSFTVYGATNFSLLRNFETAEVGFQVGGRYSFFFSKNVGFSSGIDYAQRNVSDAGDWWLPAIDLPTGLAFKYKGSTGDENIFFIGVYYAIPLRGELKSPGIPDLTVHGKDHFGIVVQTDTYFKVNPLLALGFFYSVKYGLGDTIESVDLGSTSAQSQVSPTNNLLSVNFGVAARF